jgi:hypothetical protein
MYYTNLCAVYLLTNDKCHMFVGLKDEYCYTVNELNVKIDSEICFKN